MKILRLAQKCGSPCGQLVLSTLLDENLPESYLDGYIISLRDEHWVTLLPKSESGYRQSYAKTFTLGEAKAIITETLDTPVAGRRVVKTAIESPNTADFIALYNNVYRDWLGIPHEDIPVPTYRLQEPSFISGIRNDLGDLRQFLADRWRRARAMIGQTA